jgi:hypothetical protein
MTKTQKLSAVPWRKSSYSRGNCIEAAFDFTPGAVPVRDSKDPHGPAPVFGIDAFSAFVEVVKAGQFPTF